MLSNTSYKQWQAYIILIQWILDLVTIDLVTILDLVTVLLLTNFLLSKMHRFSKKSTNSMNLCWSHNTFLYAWQSQLLIQSLVFSYILLSNHTYLKLFWVPFGSFTPLELIYILYLSSILGFLIQVTYSGLISKFLIWFFIQALYLGSLFMYVLGIP